MPTYMAKKKTICTKETIQKLLITTSSDDHRITRPHTLHVSLIQTEFSIDMLIHPPCVHSNGSLCTIHMHHHMDRLVSLGYQFNHMEDPKIVDLYATNHGELQKSLANQI